MASISRWRRESNPCGRLCRPLPHHSATPPKGRIPRADDGIRTRDPHLGKVMRYQLRYIRTQAECSGARPDRIPRGAVLRCSRPARNESIGRPDRSANRVGFSRLAEWGSMELALVRVSWPTVMRVATGAPAGVRAGDACASPRRNRPALPGVAVSLALDRAGRADRTSPGGKVPSAPARRSEPSGALATPPDRSLGAF